ncbi:MAG: hypothetical protein U1F35_22800, partial [Steroidobacteraceae bacterium]
VTVTSITLTRSDDVVVSGVSAAELVDFAKLSDVAEMVSNTAIPIGTYKSVTVNLDYTNALLFLNVNGVPKPTTIVGADGKALTTVAITVTLDPANQLTIKQSGAQRLNLDFNLAASNHIDTTASPIKVTATPFITLNNDPANTKPVRVRGPLISYSSLQNSYTVYVRPFLDEANTLGTLTLFGTPTSSYVIDNVGFSGNSGINAVTNLSTGVVTSTLATFTPDSSAGSFNIVQAYLGTAVESTTADRIEGTVIARTGDTLTLRGSTLSLKAGTFAYYPADATVSLAAATAVSVDGQPLATGIDKSDISVGQHLMAFGTSTVTSGVVALDATAGRVRLMSTRAWGTVMAGASGSASLNLAALGPWPAAAFNFAGTGTSAAQNADPASYLLSTDATDHAALVGQLAAADGIVAPFGAAPPDFLATALTPAASLDTALEVEFTSGGSKTPFSSVSSTTLVVDLADPNLGTVHRLRAGPVLTDLNSTTSPSIVASASGRSTFAIGSAAAGVKVFSKFSDFVTELNSTTTAAKAVARVVAAGRYDAATGTLTASAIEVVLQ